MRAPLRLAVLECDEPVGQTKQRYGSFSTLFAKNLQAGALRLESETGKKTREITISSYNVLINDMVYPDPESIDAVLLTGSRYDSFDSGKNDWITKLVEYIQFLLKHPTSKVRILGVCFGHQIIGRALGVLPQRSLEWEVSVTPVNLTTTGIKLFDNSKILMIHQMHRDQLTTCPEGVENLGTSTSCPVQGLYAKDRLLSLQGHPEFDGYIAGELLERRRGVVLSDEVYYSGKARVHGQHDGDLVAMAFLKFLDNGSVQ